MCVALICLCMYVWTVSTAGSPHLQPQALVKVVRAGPALQSGERHVSTGEGRDVAKLVRAEGSPLIISWADVSIHFLPIGLLARSAVILVRQPGSILTGTLVDGETLWPAGVEFQPHIRYLKCLPCGKCKGKRLTLNGIIERPIMLQRYHCLFCERQILQGGSSGPRSKGRDSEKKGALLHYREMENNGG